MKKIIFLILILIFNISFAVTEKPANKIITDKFVKEYNAENYKEIYAMFSTEMQGALPLKNTQDFLTGLKSQSGNIKNRTLIKYLNGTIASYKTEFEKAVWTLNISLDAESKINGLLVKPYVDESDLKKVVNKLSNSDKVISKKQSEIIFENTNMFPNQTQLALALIENGKVKFYGVKNNDGEISSRENSSNIFEIGSVSKVFTSTLLASFVVDEKLKLKDNINDYLDLPIKEDIKITFEQLANHTSGLPRLPSNLDLASVDPTNPYKNYGAQQLDEYLKEQLETKQTPGSKNAYSNLGAGLLGYTLSKIANSTFDELLQKHIFSKYQMNNSTSLRNNVKNPLISGLDAQGKETSNWDLAILAGAGGIYSNVEDLSKFVLSQFDSENKELTLSRQKTFEISADMEIGLGWHILKDKSDNNWYWHNGGTGGYRSSMAIDPINKNGIIILSNVSAFNPHSENIDALCFALMKTLENQD
jgi:CubicO group peptidase (beta-lactamase class C family)